MVPVTGETGILRRTERSVEISVLTTAQRQKRSTDLMFMLGLKETMDQLAMADSVRWYGHVLRRDGDHVLRRALNFKVEVQRKRVRLKRT